MPNKDIAKVWTFRSSSSIFTYETLQMVDGSTSCNCPGWTRRVDAAGNRNCKHIRSVDQGLADDEATASKDYTSGKQPFKSGQTAKPGKKSKKKSATPGAPTARKISWMDD